MKKQLRFNRTIFVLMRYLVRRLINNKYSIKLADKFAIDYLKVIMALFSLMGKLAQGKLIPFLDKKINKTLV